MVLPARAFPDFVSARAADELAPSLAESLDEIPIGHRFHSLGLAPLDIQVKGD